MFYRLKLISLPTLLHDEPLFIFAGLFGFGISQNNLVLRLCVTLVLFFLMVLLSNYDHSLHQYLHGWRRTKVELIRLIADLINNPNSELDLETYYSEGEERAEKEDCDNFSKFKIYMMKIIFKKSPTQQSNDDIIPSRMRVVFYMLVRGAIFTLIPFLIIWAKS